MSLNFVIFFMSGLQKAAAFPVTQNFTIIVHYVYLDALLLL